MFSNSEKPRIKLKQFFQKIVSIKGNYMRVRRKTDVDENLFAKFDFSVAKYIRNDVDPKDGTFFADLCYMTSQFHFMQ